MLKFFRKYKDNKSDIENIETVSDNVEVFKNILSFAADLLKSESPMRIYDLIYTLGKPYQFEVINTCIKGQRIPSGLAFCVGHLFFKNNYDLYRLPLENSSNKRIIIHPSNTLIYTFPWNSYRLNNAFINIGENVDNEWQQDPKNHRVTYIIPLNIGYVTNGNHSMAMNIINNEAPLTITEELDLTPVYNEIYTDGQYFKRIEDEKIIDEVASIELAAIFEIGRLILENEQILRKNS